MIRTLIMLAAVVPLTACAGISPSATPPTTSADATRSVPAFRETEAVTSANDAADDPAIWRNPRNPAASLIVATDKKEGLGVYDLSGRRLSNLPAGRVNNVDLRGDVMIAGRAGVLVAASDRTTLGDGRLALFALDTNAGKLRSLARVPITEMNEPYGLCLYRSRSGLFAFVVGKDGLILQVRIDMASTAPTGTIVRRMKLGTQSEGCVADDRTGQLFVAEEDVGIWRFDAAPTGPTTPMPVATDDGTLLVADAEGLAIAAEGRRGGYLVASSQGDSAYAVWRLADLSYAGRFRIAASGGIDGTTDTDGIEIATAGLGPGLSGGLMIAQDGDNAPSAQNFKLVRWVDVKRALGLK